MTWDPAPRPGGLSRRSFLGLAAAGLWIPRWARAGTLPGDERSLSPIEREHLPRIRLPAVTSNGAKVPIVIQMTHPMTPEHHVTSVRVVNESDPVPEKGTFHFTPANGVVYLAFQARMHGGVSEVSVTAECNRHGAFTSRRTIAIPEDAGGCTGTGPASIGRPEGEDVRAPVIRIAELVERGRIRRGEIVHAQVKMRHPSRTGLAFRDGGFVQESEPLHLAELEVFYGGERVSRFSMSPALSDDPFITFALLARHEGPLRVLLVNNLGRRFEATHEIHLS